MSRERHPIWEQRRILWEQHMHIDASRRNEEEEAKLVHDDDGDDEKEEDVP